MTSRSGTSRSGTSGTVTARTATPGQSSHDLIRRDLWVERAACRGPQASVFFPPSQPERREEREERERRAKAICVGCSVRATCLDYALAIHEPHGIWGGLNEIERKDLPKAATSRAG